MNKVQESNEVVSLSDARSFLRDRFYRRLDRRDDTLQSAPAMECVWEYLFAEEFTHEFLPGWHKERIARAFTFFEQNNFVVLPHVVSPACAREMGQYLLEHRMSFPQDFDREADYAGSESRYGHPLFEALLTDLRPFLSLIVGEALMPTYSFYRSYKRGAVLPEHTDRNSCEYTCSMFLGSEPVGERWGLTVRTVMGRKRSLYQAPGDLVLLRGTKVPHGRERFEGASHDQVFFHYVKDVNENARLFYDGRARDEVTFLLPRDV